MKCWMKLARLNASNVSSNMQNFRCWICLKWFTIQRLISITILNVDFNVFERLNVYSNVFITNNKMWAYLFSSQFYSMTIMNGSEEETSPVTGRAFKAHMKDKENPANICWSWRRLQDMSWRRLQQVFSVTILRLPRRLEDVLQRRLEDVLEDVKLLRFFSVLAWRHVLKTSWRYVLKTS